MTRLARHLIAQGPGIEPPAMGQGGAEEQLSSTDLAELMSAFTEVTTKLERTHGQLRSEVSRLSTELRHANEALQRSRRLAALGEMAAGISHEIRNPLGSIRLYANMLVEDLAALPEQRQIVEKIGRAVRGLDEIVGDVLTFAREMKVQWTRGDASALIGSAVEMCCAGIGAEIVRDDLGSSPVGIECDQTLIQQALINVIRNAGEANRARGGARITIGVAGGRLEDGDELVPSVVFSIRDEGDGIPPEVIERMFNPFFTTRATGTGLGLAIVHRIVDAHRGKIEVTNNGGGDEPRRGATVELHLPAAQTLTVSGGAQSPRESEVVTNPRARAAQLHGVR